MRRALLFAALAVAAASAATPVSAQ